MKGRIWTVFGLALVAALVAALFVRPPVSAGSPATGRPGGSDDGREPEAVPVVRSGTTVPASTARPPSRRWTADDPYYGDATPEAAHWLERNGYPTADEMREAGADVRALSTDDFRPPYTPSRIARADAAASAARVRPELREPAMRYLEEAAIAGSIAALEALGRLQVFPPRGDPVRADAYMRAAEMRGNWTLAVRVDTLPDLELAVMARVEAHGILAGLDAARRRRGLPPLTRDPRPGLNESLATMHQVRQGQRPIR